MTNRLSVSWTAYQKNICNGFGLLQQRGEFVDMTLAADGHHVQVHKMVMSLVSPYIKDLITATQCAHPVIFLNNMSKATLEHILEYIYTGEVLVPTECIKEFLQAGKSLHIKGLEKMSTVHLYRETEDSLKSKTISDPLQSDKKGKIVSESLDLDKKEKEDQFDDVFNNDSTFDTTTVRDDSDGGDVEMDSSQVAQNTSPETEIPPTTVKALRQDVQYTITNQGTLQIILNRYLYIFHYRRVRTDDFVWRCFETRHCMASVITRNGKVVKRSKPHNHPFHDKQILKRLNKGIVYSELGEAQNMANGKKKKKTKTDDSNNSD